MFEIKPKTRKEIYMAYLAGDMSLELPEPLTRDEVTLYNLCQSHAYGSTTTVKEVLAECQVTEALTGIPWLKIPADVVLEIGEKYIVNLNGTEYSATAYDPSINEELGEGVSSLLINDSADLSTGENLVFMIGGGEEGNFEELGYGGVIIVADGSTTLTISIRQEVTTVQKLSGKYVEGMGWREVNKAVALEKQTVDARPRATYVDIERPLVLEAGKTYDVVIDGVTYECVAQDFDGEIIVGNGSLASLPGGNGETFCIRTNPDNSEFKFYSIVSGTHIVSISDVEFTAHTYIYASFEFEDNYPQAEVGRTYNVVLDGKTYECVAQESEDGSVVLGNMNIYEENGSTEEPFAIATSEYSIWIAFTERGTHTISFEGFTKTLTAIIPCESELKCNYSIEPGQTYTVTINGMNYECAAEGDTSDIWMGNMVLVGSEGGNEEPFYMGFYDGVFYFSTFEPGTYEIEIAKVSETIHPIDQKYIVLSSPNGTKYNLTVADDGTLSAVAVI